MLLQDLLEARGMAVQFIAGDLAVLDAISLMAEGKISALVVAHDDQPIGIFTERDIMRCHVNHGDRPISQVMVQQVMTNKLFIAECTEEISKVMPVMLQMDIRHLPVAKDGRIVGIIPLRELVQHHVSSLDAELRYLQDYIADLQEAGRD